MAWWRKNLGKTEDEHGKLWDNVKDMQVKLVKMEAEIEKQSQSLLVLRAFVNRRLKLAPDEAEKEDLVISGEELAPEINDGFDYLR